MVRGPYARADLGVHVDVENPKDDSTLIGYWKFNENKGNTIKDYSKYGNDGVAKYDIVWPAGIEIPEINKTEE